MGAYDYCDYYVDRVAIFKGNWTRADWELNESLAHHCAVALSEKEVVTIGGRTDVKNSDETKTVDSVTKYNTETGASISLAPIPTPVAHHACVKTESFIY